jgi:hypothetical protein
MYVLDGRRRIANKGLTVIWISELIRVQANQLVFIALSHYQLNGRERKSPGSANDDILWLLSQLKSN